MKKTFESFAPCLELREVIFLRSLPTHAHLVPALDIFLDPLSKKLHICMEYMDGNLYQLMKARDHKLLDGSSVKSILFQILGGLEHIHAHNFFHRDIKPENILVSTSAPMESSNTFRRYSSIVTPPSTPSLYTIKIADFGLARETHSQHPYTTYVSTRWYRAPEVLLRAGEYSAPVDIWAIGAMAVEIANLKPLFPGGNEVDQVWRVCEIMGSPGNWYDKHGNRVGGGDWREGTRLAQKLGFSFPKVSSQRVIYTYFIPDLDQMAPHSMETILRPPQWPASLSSFVTWCLMWDPRNRPTSAQAMKHEYFADAVDPLRPKSSTSRFLGRKQPSVDSKSRRDSNDTPQLTSKPSWFRKSLIGRDSAPVVPLEVNGQTAPQHPSPTQVNLLAASTIAETAPLKHRPFANKRATWTNSATPVIGAPMPILPSIRPISPFSDAVTAQAHTRPLNGGENMAPNSTVTEQKISKKIGRQLSVASNGNHYSDSHRHDSDRTLNGVRDVVSPNGTQKEGFFSHLRKRARRLSGRPQAPMSPTVDDIEANAGCAPWQSNRGSMISDPNISIDPIVRQDPKVTELDAALRSPRYVVESSSSINLPSQKLNLDYMGASNHNMPERHHSLSRNRGPDVPNSLGPGTLISTRTRRVLQHPTNPSQVYETPDEEEELLHDALRSASHATKGMDHWTDRDQRHRQAMAHKDVNKQPIQHGPGSSSATNPYPTPSPSAKRSGVLFNQTLMAEPATPVSITKPRHKEDLAPKWPTPPYEENEWAAAAAASIFAAGSIYE